MSEGRFLASSSFSVLLQAFLANQAKCSFEKSVAIMAHRRGDTRETGALEGPWAETPGPGQMVVELLGNVDLASAHLGLSSTEDQAQQLRVQLLCLQLVPFLAPHCLGPLGPHGVVLPCPRGPRALVVPMAAGLPGPLGHCALLGAHKGFGFLCRCPALL